MPYGLRKLPNQDLYKVYNKDTDEVHSKATTKGNALKQIRLLYMLERKKEKEGGEIGYFKNTYPKLDRTMEQDRTTDYYTDGSVNMKKCNCKTDTLIEGSGKPKAEKTFEPPYQPTGNYMTAWRWVLYKERDLQNSTYAKMMRNPSVKSLYYKLKEKAENKGEDFNVDWLEANYMKNRKGIKGDEPVVKEKKPKKDFSKGSKKIDEFFK
jgi:hypothetical protein